jgi:hypothetical protein
MTIIPPLRTERFEQLQPGELFMMFENSVPCYGIKTEQPANGDRSGMVVLGPRFPYEADEAFLIGWQAGTVISAGKDYTAILPTDPAAWILSGNARKPVCLALSDNRVFVCANGGHSPQHCVARYVELNTGKVESRLPSHAAYTNSWQIAFIDKQSRQHTFLEYPLREATK